jgi:hypothetical protein
MDEKENNEVVEAEEQIEDAVDASVASDAPGGKKPKKKKTKLLIVLGVVAVIIVAAGAGFWIWHEQPSFCGAICHQPMAEYVATYDLEPGVAGVDKWGNPVENTNSMMVVTHKAEGEDCLACHVPSIAEQVTEGIAWVSGNYTYPLAERELSDLCEARGIEDTQFCLNDSCHHVSESGAAITNEEDLKTALTGLHYNPHNPGNGVVAHQDFDCGDCHNAHRASVVQCTACHAAAEVPEGWLKVADEKDLTIVKPAAKK